MLASFYGISPREAEKLKKKDVDALLFIEGIMHEQQKEEQEKKNEEMPDHSNKFKGVKYL